MLAELSYWKIHHTSQTQHNGIPAMSTEVGESWWLSGESWWGRVGRLGRLRTHCLRWGTKSCHHHISTRDMLGGYYINIVRTCRHRGASQHQKMGFYIGLANRPGSLSNTPTCLHVLGKDREACRAQHGSTPWLRPCQSLSARVVGMAVRAEPCLARAGHDPTCFFIFFVRNGRL